MPPRNSSPLQEVLRCYRNALQGDPLAPLDSFLDSRYSGEERRQLFRSLLAKERTARTGAVPRPRHDFDSYRERPWFDEFVDDIVGVFIEEDYLYRYIRPLGSGGMGRVYLVHNRNTGNRSEALKVLLPNRLAELTDEARRRLLERFTRESAALTRIDHPHIPRVYQGGMVIHGMHFFTMEHISGKNIIARLHHAGREKPDAGVIRQTVEWLVPIAEALGVIHDEGIVHRDVKPQNLIFHEERRRLYLVDFGISRVPPRLLENGNLLTERHVGMGTPEYIAPEQAYDAATVTPAADIFSFGATLYHLITGHPPFTDACHRPFLERPSHLNPAIHTALDAICMCCLRVQPDERYPDAHMLARALRASLERPGPTILDVQRSPIKVGILQPQHGRLASNGMAVTEAVRLAVDEINQQGGVLGRRIDPLVPNCGSEEGCQELAERLIARDGVSVLFGGWSLPSRRAISAGLQARDHLLFYPYPDEDSSGSPHLVHMSPTLGQQVEAIEQFVFGVLGKRRLFLAGVEDGFSRSAHSILRSHPGRCEIVGEAMTGTPSQVRGMLRGMRKASAELILNTCPPLTSEALFEALAEHGVCPRQTPTLSWRISENDLCRFSPSAVRVGDYAIGSYFQSVERGRNTLFVECFRRQYGPNRVLSDAMETAYCSVHLWAQAAAKAGDVQPTAVRRCLMGLQLVAPGAEIVVGANQRVCKPIRIGRINAQNQFDIVCEAANGAAVKVA